MKLLIGIIVGSVMTIGFVAYYPKIHNKTMSVAYRVENNVREMLK